MFPGPLVRGAASRPRPTSTSTRPVEVITPVVPRTRVRHTATASLHRDVKPGQPARVGLRGGEARRTSGSRARSDQSSITQVGSVLGNRGVSSARAGPRRGGRPAGRHLLARRRGLPADVRPAAIRGVRRCRSWRSSSNREAPIPLDQLQTIALPRTLAQAVVATAIAIEQEDRPGDALTFGEVVRKRLARGIAPGAVAWPRSDGNEARTRRADRAAKEFPRGATRVRRGRARPATTRQPATAADEVPRTG